MTKLIKKALRDHWIPLVVLLFTWGAYFIFLFARILQIKPGGVYAGHVNVWSDWSLHIAIANIFAFKAPQYWFAYHPLFAAGKFTYPFVADFITGMLMRAGTPLVPAFAIPSIITALLMLMGAYALAYLLLGSKKRAFVAVSLFLLSAGFGFLHFLQDFASNPSWQAIAYPAKEYGRFDIYQWYAGNVAVGLLVPQRAFLLGFATGTWSLFCLLFALISEKARPYRRGLLLTAGILAGLLPIIHPHTFIFLIIVTGIICFSYIKKWKLLAWYVLPAAALSSILFFIFIYGGIQISHFATWFPGWTAHGFLDWLTMWFWLWGIAIPVALAGWFVLPKHRAIRAFFAGTIVVFAIANLFLFQPIAWDNSKLFFWAYFGFSCMMAAMLGWMWNSKKCLLVSGSVILFILLTFTGALELTRLQRVDKNSYLMTTTDDINLGLEIRDNTAPTARFLTDTSHNHFIMMWGLRPILMGYTAWVWNFGFNYQQTEQDIHIMYAGGPDTPALLKKYNVSYVVIGPGELNNMHANQQYYASNFPVAFQDSSYKIYDVRSVTQSSANIN